MDLFMHELIGKIRRQEKKKRLSELNLPPDTRKQYIDLSTKTFNCKKCNTIKKIKTKSKKYRDILNEFKAFKKFHSSC